MTVVPVDALGGPDSRPGRIPASSWSALSFPKVAVYELREPDFSPPPPNTAPWQAEVSQIPGVP